MASLLSQATKSRIHKPIKIVIYGEDGVGKTKFACGAPNPIVVGTEDGAHRYGATETPVAKSLQDLEDTLLELASTKGAGYKTLVLDAMDGIETLVERATCKEKKVDSLEDIGYGKGTMFMRDRFLKFLDLVDTCRTEGGMNVIMIAHSHVKKINDPSQPAPYDRHQLKLDDKNAAKIREWSDAVLFACNETFVKTDKSGNKGKGIGDGKRIMFTERRPAYDAKNRDGLPHKMDLSFDAFNEAINRSDADIAQGLINECNFCIETVEDQELRALMQETVSKAGQDVQLLREILNRIKTRIGDN